MLQWDSVTLGVIGLGYVGLPVALAFARAFPDTIGFDVDSTRVAELSRGIDLTGESAFKNLKVLFAAARQRKSEALLILGLQAGLLALSIVFMRPFAYVVWILSWSTLWKFSNRLRAIAEHGGMERSRDRRRTTHVIRQSLLARYWMVPYHTGWHLAHHADMAVPWTQLPRLHDELVASGWITPDIEYPSYRAFWKACSAGAERGPSSRATGNSQLSFDD